jgi:NitT/TauT family transport system substrate-binding protein
MTTKSAVPLLRLNQGDPSEARVYYLAHFVAGDLHFFEQEGVNIDFASTRAGADGIGGGQIRGVLSGEADLTIGGPMATMRLLQDGAANLMSFCAAVNINPWYLVARQPTPDFKWDQLRGRTIFDIANIDTASLCFRWLLRQKGLTDEDVQVVLGSGREGDDFDAFTDGKTDYAIHSLHALAPLLATGRLAVVSDLGGPTGPVPWSTYIAAPELLQSRRSDFVAFVRAMARALGWIQSHTGQDIGSLIQRHYPGYPLVGLVEAITRYKAIGAWPVDPLVRKSDFDHFGQILTAVGWLDEPVAYESQVDPWFAEAANAAGAPGG